MSSSSSRTGASAGNPGRAAGTRTPLWTLRPRPGGGTFGATRLTPDGPDATIVTEIYDCSRAPEEERVGMDNGKIWTKSMAETLERLDRACTGR